MKAPKICLKIAPAADRLPIAPSKFFGNPDLWNGFEWPEYLDADGEWYCMDFIGQLNCADLVPFDSHGLFPKSGMLYFFYPLEDTPFLCRTASPFAITTAERHQGWENLSCSLRDGTLAASCKQKIESHMADPDAEPPYPDHHLLGEPSVPPLDGDAVGLENMILLLELYSFQTEDRSISFGDDGTLHFYVDPERLKNGDVLAVQVRLNAT